MTEVIIYIIGFDLFLCAMIGMAGSERRIGFWEAFFFSIIFTPIIGLIICLLSPRLNKLELENAQITALQKRHDHNISDELTKLAELRDRGVLTAEEFNTQKEKLINRN